MTCPLKFKNGTYVVSHAYCFNYLQQLINEIKTFYFTWQVRCKRPLFIWKARLPSSLTKKKFKIFFFVKPAKLCQFLYGNVKVLMSADQWLVKMTQGCTIPFCYLSFIFPNHMLRDMIFDLHNKLWVNRVSIIISSPNFEFWILTFPGEQ